MVNAKIRLIVFFTVEDGEALYSQRKQDWELTVAQILSSLFQVKWNSLSHVQLFVTLWTIQSMEFSRPEYWSG